MSLHLLFVHNRSSTFVQTDLELLRERYAVTEWYQHGRAVNLAALKRAVAASDLVYGWFASWHTFLPVMLARRFRLPTILVVGGYDTAKLPAIGYGNQRGGLRRLISSSTMHHATRLVTNSFFARDEAVRNVGIAPERISVLYHGLPAVPPVSIKPATPLVITVGDVAKDTLHRKGLIPFVRAAALLPDVRFALVGEWRDQAIESLRRSAPPNLVFTGRVSVEEMQTYMSRAHVYVQASQHEGFGLALAEAMLHACIPVVTRAGALPEVVGEAGVYTSAVDPTSLAASIRYALSMDATWGGRARARIVANFPVERRREGLEKILESVMYDTHRLAIGQRDSAYS